MIEMHEKMAAAHEVDCPMGMGENGMKGRGMGAGAPPNALSASSSGSRSRASRFGHRRTSGSCWGSSSDGDGSVRRAAHESGGFKSLCRSDEERHIQRRDVMSRWLEASGRNQWELSCDEPVGQRGDKVEPALWGRRRSRSLLVPRCLRTARCGRYIRDLGRARGGPGRQLPYFVRWTAPPSS